MVQKLVGYSLVSLATVTLLGFALLGLAQSNKQVSPQDDDRFGPVSTYREATALPSNASEQRLRKARSDRYDVKDQDIWSPERLHKIVLGENSPPVLYNLPSSHAPDVAAIPAGKSDLVVVGTIQSAHAYLTNHKTAIYSEFQVKVEQVLKGSRSGVGEIIDTERFGGRLRMPSGQTLVR